MATIFFQLRARGWTGMAWRPPGRVTVVLAFVVAMVFSVVDAAADPASTIQTLMIVDQGDFLSFQWSFYYVDFPAHFVLKEKDAKKIDLTDPATLDQNLSDLVSVGFDLRINGRSVRPDKVSRLAISPNKICTVTMIYRGVPGGQLELRAPILQYLPPTAMVNYEILRLNQANQIVTGNLMGHAGPFPQTIIYRELGQAGQPAPTLESAPLALFRSQLRTAWINSNWLLLSALLLLVHPLREALVPLAILVAGWVIVSLFSIWDLRFPWAIPGLVACLPTVVAGVMIARFPARWFALLAVVGATALLNAGYDLQQVSWRPEDQTFPALAGLCLGFFTGFALVVLVWAMLFAECRKLPEFSTQWSPRIAWLLAAAALLLPLQKLIFR